METESTKIAKNPIVRVDHNGNFFLATEKGKPTVDWTDFRERLKNELTCLGTMLTGLGVNNDIGYGTIRKIADTANVPFNLVAESLNSAAETIETLIKEPWHQIDENDLLAEKAVRIFVSEVCNSGICKVTMKKK